MLMLLKQVTQLRLGLQTEQVPTLFEFIVRIALPKQERQFDGEPITHVAQLDVQGIHAAALFTI